MLSSRETEGTSRPARKIINGMYWISPGHVVTARQQSSAVRIPCTPSISMRGAQVPNGELTAKQLRFLAGCIEPYGEKGCADITTRANLQLRGLTLGEADQVMEVRRLCGRKYMRNACSTRHSKQNCNNYHAASCWDR